MATSQSKQALRAKRKQLGLCIHCGDPAIPDQTRCESCRDKDKANRKRYAERDAKRGICKNTGCSNKPTGEKSYCNACNARSTRNGAKRATVRKAAGICVDCGNEPAWNSKTRCECCHRKNIESVQQLAKRRIAEGKCGRCGDHVLEPGYRSCRGCIDDRRAFHAALKLEVLKAYGGAICIGCDETEICVLQINHIGGGGHAHALEIGNGNVAVGRSKMYRWLKQQGYPEGYNVTCANCNLRLARGVPLPNQ